MTWRTLLYSPFDRSSSSVPQLGHVTLMCHIFLGIHKKRSRAKYAARVGFAVCISLGGCHQFARLVVRTSLALPFAGPETKRARPIHAWSRTRTVDFHPSGRRCRKSVGRLTRDDVGEVVRLTPVVGGKVVTLTPVVGGEVVTLAAAGWNKATAGLSSGQSVSQSVTVGLRFAEMSHVSPLRLLTYPTTWPCRRSRGWSRSITRCRSRRGSWAFTQHLKTTQQCFTSGSR